MEKLTAHEEQAMLAILEQEEMDVTRSDMVARAVAFGQIKVTGRVDPRLKALALNAIRRINMIFGQGRSEGSGWLTDDLEKFGIYQ